MDQERKPRYRQPRTLSCLPCRERKLKCDRQLPCQNCSRYKRESMCMKHPSPATVLTGKQAKTSRTVSRLAEPGQRELVQKPLSPSNSDVSNDDCSTSMLLGETSSTSSSEQQTASALSKTVSDLHMSNHSADLRIQSQGNLLKNWVGVEPSYLPCILNPMIHVLASQGLSTPNHEGLPDPSLYWRWYLGNLLPSQTQCDFLVSYFIENLNWIYHAIHIPSFRRQYAEFWLKPIGEVDLIWLSLLYIILSLSALYIPDQSAVAIGFAPGKINTLCHTWYSASRQALHAGDFESKPSLYQIQTFLLSQLYWYATKNIELLNSNLGMTIRNAQAIGLDKDVHNLNCLERELRRRLWWDLVSSDTFQSLCLGRIALLQSHLSEVPFPSNCNDIDVTEDSITVHPMEEPTEFTMHVYRARVFKILNKLYINNGAGLSSFEYIRSIDDEINTITDEYPWYSPLKNPNTELPTSFKFISWGFHVLHSCICVQRIRMYRPFLNPRVQDSWSRCLQAANDALAVYRRIRSASPDQLRYDQKAQVQNYQTFSTAITIAIFLLVERPEEPESIRSDIDMVLSDLEPLDGVDSRVPMVVDGRKALRKVLSLYDQRDRADASEPTALVPAVYTVIGGENTTLRYLERCAIDYIINNEQFSGHNVQNGMSSGPWSNSATGGEILTGPIDLQTMAYIPRNYEWDFLLDMSNWSQWDSLWPEVEVVE